MTTFYFYHHVKERLSCCLTLQRYEQKKSQPRESLSWE